MVQFAVDPRDGSEFAFKLFLQEEVFTAEAALYAACFPSTCTHLSPAIIHGPSGDAALSPHPTYRDQPHLVNLTSHHSTPLWLDSGVTTVHFFIFSANSRCIVTRWKLQMLSNVASRLAVMHEAGCVHRELKPANVMWLPRENRWTVIDFGCATRVGEIAPLSFTLAYTPPEVVIAHEADAKRLLVTPALDAWSLGVMAFELFTGSPAFKFLTDGWQQPSQPSQPSQSSQ